MPRDYWLRHGHARRATGFGDATYRCWRNMRARCENPRASAYDRYGSKGIHVCDRWKVFDNFLADMGEKPKGLTIERIDGSKGYEPGSCRWATITEQARNQSSNHLLTAQGQTMPIAAWAEIAGIKQQTISGRIRRRWDSERAIFAPLQFTPRWHTAAIKEGE